MGKAASPFDFAQGRQERLCHRLRDWNGWFARGGAGRHTRGLLRRDFLLWDREPTLSMQSLPVNLSNRGKIGVVRIRARRVASLVLAAQLVSLPGLAAGEKGKATAEPVP